MMVRTAAAFDLKEVAYSLMVKILNPERYGILTLATGFACEIPRKMSLTDCPGNQGRFVDFTRPHLGRVFSAAFERPVSFPRATRDFNSF